jgi:hypothetical protein
LRKSIACSLWRLACRDCSLAPAPAEPENGVSQLSCHSHFAGHGDLSIWKY